MPPVQSQSRHWVFTINNYDDADIARLDALPSVTYLIYGIETGASGTPHLQGYVCFDIRKRLSQAKRLISDRAHLERMRGTSTQASAYCKKDGNFTERGEAPSTGPPSKFEDVKEFALAIHASQGRPPNDRELADSFPGHFIRYSRALLEYCRLICPEPDLQHGELREWQQLLHTELLAEPNDREIRFIVDPAGGTGKTWFQRYLLTERPEDVQVLSGGKRDDIAHAIDSSKKVFLFNVPRQGMEYLQYTILEQIKDRMVFSPKYNSRTKILPKAHVVVFCNEHPDLDKMTPDRYNITDFSNAIYVEDPQFITA